MTSSLLPENWLNQSLLSIATLAPVTPVQIDEIKNTSINLFLKREELLDEEVGGNKFYKLYGFLKDWVQYGKALPIASFGGAYSNHIYALAMMCRKLSIPAIGIIRGEKPKNLSPTLVDAEKAGMRLIFISRSDYRKKSDPAYLASLALQIGEVYWVPEGGGGLLGAKGCREYAQGLLANHPEIDVLCHACGTGASLAGLIAGAKNTEVLGFSVLKHDQSSDVLDLLPLLEGENARWRIETSYHGGGYAKLDSTIRDFIVSFEHQTGIALDPVYTGKMMYGVVELINRESWAPGTNILAIHSGGIQGRRGYLDQF